MASLLTFAIDVKDGDAKATLAGVKAQLEQLGVSASGLQVGFQQAKSHTAGFEGAVKKLGSEMRQHDRLFGFFGRKLAETGLLAKEAGSALTGMAVGLASGSGLLVAVEGVKLLKGLLESLGEESDKAHKAFSKMLDDWAEKGKKAADEADRLVLAMSGMSSTQIELRKLTTEYDKQVVALNDLYRKREDLKGQYSSVGDENAASALSAEIADVTAQIGKQEDAVRKLGKAKGEIETQVRAEQGQSASRVPVEDEKRAEANKVFVLQKELELKDGVDKILAEGELEKEKIWQRSDQMNQRQYDQEIAVVERATARKIALYQREQEAKANKDYWAAVARNSEAGTESEGMDLSKSPAQVMAEATKNADAALKKSLEERKRQIQEMATLGQHMGQTFGAAFAGMVTGSMSFGKALGSVLRESLKLLMEWVVKSITMKAADAAAGAADSQAWIPGAGPGLAVAAAGAMEAFVIGLLPSAAGGYDVGNYNPLTQLHAREMVLPAPLAERVRNMTGNGGGGDTINLHISAVDGPSLRRFLLDNRGEMLPALAALARDRRA